MAEPRSSRGKELSSLIRLAFPITLVQVGMMLMGVVDTMMVGRVSVEAIAAAQPARPRTSHSSAGMS